jgi:hypothetical protein
MGSHYIVWLDFAGTLWSAVHAGMLSVRVDDTVRFSIDLTKVTVLDRTTEQRL